MITHHPYPIDVSDAEWEFVLPYLRLLPEDAGQREHGLRDVSDALRWLVRTGAQGVPSPVTSRPRRWSTGRPAVGSPPVSSRRSSTTSEPCSASPRAAYEGYKRRKGSNVYMAVDTLRNLPDLHVTPADEQDRDQVAALPDAVLQLTWESVELAYVD